MLLCLDVGNTHIFGGVFIDDGIQFRFRYPAKQAFTSDVFGTFLKSVLRENNLDPKDIKQICIASVVPEIDYTVNAACIKYFQITPLQIKPGIKTGICLKINNPLELGADRIANAVAATAAYPQQNIIVVDFGTATTICAINHKKEYLGGAILPGFKVSMQALAQKAAKLSFVDIIKPNTALGKTTTSQIQTGIFYAQYGAIKTITDDFKANVFKQQSVTIIATGGYAPLLRDQLIFSAIIPDLVLHGLRLVAIKNQSLATENI